MEAKDSNFLNSGICGSINVGTGTWSGGAAYVAGGSFTCSNCTFKGTNIAQCGSNTDGAAYGGALHQTGGTVVITHSAFQDNVANVGGGVYMTGGSATFNHSYFSGNTLSATGVPTSMQLFGGGM